MTLPGINCVNMLRGALGIQRSSFRLLQTTAVCHKVVAGRVRVSKGEKPVTYEQSNPPHYIGVRKGWNSKHTANLEGEIGTADRVLEDLFIRKFMYGTFHNCMATELVIKRRANQIFIAAIMLRNQAPQKYYFLIGYTEELLSHWFKCPVKLEVQIVEDRPVYKWI
ncbi:28S ribosomal protein S24-A, mitochondrial [Strongylocentrotus purpuratus]|uniref:28S ribosomal protein S24, mitochondrial n=1 Tax=Strongylocentrotus purpuratus TaxID=7668 RepID=A0A7M7REG2_STRPU|nr:28S ribosomal protein S24-A, mitochondrial [Strongylocentrotus purpuratus]|eukprot:XP_784440.1 PREDICTED: 28S ribosomal protein S24-A, mitochondrial [Strongylocentrotus purpuratus]